MRIPKIYNERGELQCLDCEFFYVETINFGLKNRKCSKCMNYRKVHGVGYRDVCNLIIDQCGRCKICLEELERRVALDHNHLTGRIRGILCLKCNLGLGYLEKRPVDYAKIRQYLSRGSYVFPEKLSETRVKHKYISDGNLHRCVECGNFKSSSKFSGGKNKPHHSLRKICKQCRTYVYEWKLSYKHIEYMLSISENSCEICESSYSNERLIIDHDHKCCSVDRMCPKCVRGVLCDTCNKMIGFFKEDIKIMKEAGKYAKQ